MKHQIMTLYAKAINRQLFNAWFLQIIPLGILLLLNTHSTAQLPDTIVIHRNDTIIKLINPGDAPKKMTGLKLEELLQKNSERNFFSRKLHDWLVKASFNKNPQPDLTPQRDYSGKTIHTINIRSIPPFGGSVYDTIAFQQSWVERLGNKLRFETSPRIIRKTITTQEGRTLKKLDLSDSERLLRGLSFINDARIIATPLSEDSTMVDLTVYVQDRYPYAVSLNFKNDQPYITLINKNIFGRGFALNNSLAAPSINNPKWGFRELFRAENIMGRYINMELDYSKIIDRHFFSSSIEKEFLLPETQYAGGISFNRSYANPGLADYPSLEWEEPLNYRRQNYWLGRSFRLNSENKTVRSNFYLLGRYMNLNLIHQSPEEPPVIRPGRFFFSGIGISKRSYYRNNLIYSFGKTEDVPYGFLSTITYGHHQNDTLSRHFIALHYSMGKALIPSKGYLYFSGDASTFFNHHSIEQGVINLRSEYISPLIPVGTNKLRGFLELQYVKGFNRLEGEKLYLDERINGLRGFDYRDQLTGTEKAILKTEQLFFTRLEPLGFKFAIFSFLDMAFLRENNQGLFHRSPYFSFGAGLRIRNDHMVFNTLQIRLAFMPRVPSSELPVSFRINGEPVKHFTDFAPKQPGGNTYY